MTKQTFLKGTILLAVSGLLTRILGFINRIVVARIMGSEGIGLYMMAVPTLLLAITVTQLGLPPAIAKLVSEAAAKNDVTKIKRIIVTSLTVTGILSIIFTILLFMVAPIAAHILFTDSRTLYPLLAIAPVIPIVAISSVIKGYFQGIQNMKPSAFSQLLEQVVRISCIAALTMLLLPYGIEFAAAGAMISSVIGEFVSLLYMLYQFRKQKNFSVRIGFFTTLKERGKTFGELMETALPTTGSRLVGSASMFVEPIIVAQSLALAGIATTTATIQYGQLTGYALPLLMLPSFFTFALSVSLVPNISEAVARKDYRLIQYRTIQSIHWSLLSGVLPAVVMYTFSDEILTLMYGNNEAAYLLKMMSPLFIFYYFIGPLSSILQGLNLAAASMWNSIIGAIVKVVLLFGLVTQPQFGIKGAALAISTSLLVITLLHFATILKRVPMILPFGSYIKFVIVGVVTAYASTFIKSIEWQHHLLIDTTLQLCITSLLYVVLLFVFGLLKASHFKKQ